MSIVCFHHIFKYKKGPTSQVSWAMETSESYIESQVHVTQLIYDTTFENVYAHKESLHCL